MPKKPANETGAPEGALSLADLPAPDHVSELRTQLAAGYRKAAAETVRHIARSTDGDARPALELIAAHLEEIGNSYKSRKRPTVTFESDPKLARKNFLRSSQVQIHRNLARVAHTAKRVEAVVKVDNDDLAELCWKLGLRNEEDVSDSVAGQMSAVAAAVESDPEDALSVVRPLAPAFLKAEGLDHIPLQGFAIKAFQHLQDRGKLRR